MLQKYVKEVSSMKPNTPVYNWIVFSWVESINFGRSLTRRCEKREAESRVNVRSPAIKPHTWIANLRISLPILRQRFLTTFTIDRCSCHFHQLFAESEVTQYLPCSLPEYNSGSDLGELCRRLVYIHLDVRVLSKGNC